MRVGDPARVRVDGEHCPHERAENEQDVDGGEEIVFEPELQRREREVEKQIEDEWQRDGERDLLLPRHNENFSERDCDDDVERRPDGAKEPCGWRPGWFDELGVPVVGAHIFDSEVI